jgi:hypothetical protein
MINRVGLPEIVEQAYVVPEYPYPDRFCSADNPQSGFVLLLGLSPFERSCSQLNAAFAPGLPTLLTA